jgi:hypothetical protein
MTCVPAAVPSLLHRRTPVLSPRAAKNALPANDTISAGAEPLPSGACTSFSSVVPAAVRSLIHGSRPWPPFAE